MICKIQKPIVGSMADALVYNEDRSVLFHMPMTEEVRDLFRNGQLKVFHQCHIIEGGILNIGDRVKDPGW